VTGQRIVFAGPSLSRADIAGHGALKFLPPVARDDILRAIDDGPEAIGIVDGYFGDRPSVLHKEILEAIAEGIQVYGAASMGALRACELHSLGMIGVGRIFRAYLNGDLTSDADVAVAHGPAELGFPVLSVAQVDVAATARALAAREHLGQEEARALVRTSAEIFYADRTWRRVAEACAGPREAVNLAALLASSHVEAKRLDAIKLLRTVERASPTDARATRAFRPPRTPSFRRRLAAVGR
jgi:hypothetical protein